MKYSRHGVSTDEVCKQPSWNRITDECKKKIESKFPQYGNSWENQNIPLSWWKDRLLGEIDEIFKLPFTPEERQKEIIDAINILAMMYNLAGKQYWDEVVESRLGIR